METHEEDGADVLLVHSWEGDDTYREQMQEEVFVEVP